MGDFQACPLWAWEIAVEPGKQYTYGFYVKTLNGPTYVGGQISLHDSNRKYLRNHASGRGGTSSDGVWEEYALPFVVPADVAFIGCQWYAASGEPMANHGKYGKWQLFSEETYQQIIPVSLQPYFPDVKMKYGIGLQDKSGMLGSGSYGHGGGCGTQLIVNPDKHLVFAMVRNNPGPGDGEHLSAVTDALRAWIEE